jgi:hypothetical protein
LQFRPPPPLPVFDDYSLDACSKELHCSVSEPRGYPGPGHPYESPEDSTMPRINDQILECACYVYDSENDASAGRKAGGAGFLAAVRFKKVHHCVQIYAVTNEHVIRDVQRPAIRINVPGSGAEVLVPRKRDWTTHPDGDDLAIAAIKIEPFTLPVRYILPEGFLTEEIIKTFDLGPGDETFMIGRFIGHEGKQRNTPTVRFGNISMMPIEPMRRPNGKEQKAFLVECRSIPGFSGSPVFIWVPPMSPRPPSGQSYSSALGPWLGSSRGHA